MDESFKEFWVATLVLHMEQKLTFEKRSIFYIKVRLV